MWINTKKLTLILTASSILSGCATFDSIGAGFTSQKYRDVQSGDRARIRVLESGGEQVMFYPNSTCQTTTDKDRGTARTKHLPISFKDHLLSKPVRYEPKSLNMPFQPNTDKGQQYFEFYVPANRPFLITAYWNFMGQVSCPSPSRIVNFVPDRNYEFSFNIMPNGACGYELKEINDQGERIAFDRQNILSDAALICSSK